MQRSLAVVSRAGVLSALLVSMPALSASAADQPTGKAEYTKYCGACHGPAAQGDGFVGTFLRPKPPDLTQLAKKAGGEFPTARVMQTIDGRLPIGAHGKTDMPVWGEILGEEAGRSPAAEAVIRGKVSAITEYLRSVQVK